MTQNITEHDQDYHYVHCLRSTEYQKSGSLNLWIEYYLLFFIQTFYIFDSISWSLENTVRSKCSSTLTSNLNFHHRENVYCCHFKYHKSSFHSFIFYTAVPTLYWLKCIEFFNCDCPKSSPRWLTWSQNAQC